MLGVLAQLREEHYGYSLRKSLADKGLNVEEGTLYPLIRRLEKQGLLESEWREEDKRKKRFYRLSDLGREVYEQLMSDWNELNDIAPYPLFAASASFCWSCSRNSSMILARQSARECSASMYCSALQPTF